MRDSTVQKANKAINLKKNILLSSSFRLVIMFFGVITGWISTRYLGVEIKGQYSYLITSATFITMILGLGLYQSYPYILRKEPERIGNILQWSLFMYVSELLLFTSLGYYFLEFWSIQSGINLQMVLIFAFAIYIASSKFSMQMQQIYIGQDRVFTNSIVQLLRTLLVLSAVLIAYFGKIDNDKLSYLIISIAIADVICVLIYVFGQNWLHLFRRFDFGFIVRTYGLGIKVFLSSLFILLLIRSDIFLIKKFLNFKDVGIYAISANIVDMLQLLSNIVGGLLLVKLSDHKNHAESWYLMKKVLMSFTILLGLINIGFVIAGKPLMAILYGNDFIPSYYVYLWLIPASFGLSFGSLFNTYLWSKGFPIVSILLPMGALVLNVVINIILIPIMGITGAALSTSIAYILWFVSIVVFEHYHSGGKLIAAIIPKPNDWRDFISSEYTQLRNRFRGAIR